MCEAAEHKSCSFAVRAGGGNHLGLRLQDVAPEHVVRVWRVSGVFLEWSDEELQTVLLEESWLDVEIVARPRFRKQPWLVRAPSSLVGVVAAAAAAAAAAVNVDPYLLTLQRATQTKPKDASSPRLNERGN